VADPVLVPRRPEPWRTQPEEAVPAAPEASEETPKPIDPAPAPKEPTTGPTTGFMIEARLAQTFAPIDTSNVATPISAFTLTPPPVALGYRGESFAIVGGLMWNRFEQDTGKSGNSVTVSFFGVTALGEFTVAHSDDRRAEGYLVTGLSLSSPSVSRTGQSSSPDDGFSGELAWGMLAGGGARYWVSPHLGIGAELGLGYVNYPAGKSASTVSTGGGTPTTDSENQRGNALSTFGSIGVTLVL
jgi:hypothetical protein